MILELSEPMLCFFVAGSFPFSVDCPLQIGYDPSVLSSGPRQPNDSADIMGQDIYDWFLDRHGVRFADWMVDSTRCLSHLDAFACQPLSRVVRPGSSVESHEDEFRTKVEGLARDEGMLPDKVAFPKSCPGLCARECH